MLKSGNFVAIGQAKLRHAIEGRSLDARLGDLAWQGACAQGIAKDRFETKDRGFGQGTTMIAGFLFPALATDAPNAAQVLVAGQGWLG